MTSKRVSSDVRFLVNVDDLDAAKRFWVKRLRFAVTREFTGGLMIDLGSATLEFFASDSPAPSTPARLSIEVGDLDRLWTDWVGAPEVGHSLRTNDWGDRSFSLIDPNRVEVIFFQPLAI